MLICTLTWKHIFLWKERILCQRDTLNPSLCWLWIVFFSVVQSASDPWTWIRTFLWKEPFQPDLLTLSLPRITLSSTRCPFQQCSRRRSGRIVLQCVAVCCSVLQCVAVCCSRRRSGRISQTSAPYTIDDVKWNNSRCEMTVELTFEKFEQYWDRPPARRTRPHCALRAGATPWRGNSVKRDLYEFKRALDPESKDIYIQFQKGPKTPLLCSTSRFDTVER